MSKVDDLSDFLKEVDDTIGKGLLFRGDDTSGVPDVARFSTGSLNLDLITGKYGEGRVVEIYGGESSGKTTLAVLAAAEKQRNGEIVGIIDMEHALDKEYAALLGLDMEKVYIAQPDFGEQALTLAESMVKSGKFGLIIVDSVAALVPKKELEGEMGDSHMGLQARLMSQALRKITGAISKSNTAIIFINQLRQKIGVVFGNPNVTTGGNALKYYASQRLEISRGTPIKNKEEVIGHNIRVKVAKNKLAAPFMKAELPLIYGHGISKEMELLTLASDSGIIEKKGSRYYYNGTIIANGVNASRLVLEENPDLFNEIFSIWENTQKEG